MNDTEKTKAQLIQELAELRQHVAELEAEKDARQQTEEALRESEHKLRGLIENSTDAIRLFNEKGVIEVWNPASVTLYGIPPEEAIGRYVWDVEAELGFEDYREQGLEVLRTGQIPDEWASIEFTIEHPDGSTRYIQGKAFMIPTEKGYWGASIHREISERFTMEKALRESEVKYRELVENMHDAIYIVDENYRVTYISPAIEPFLGYQPSEILGQPFTQFIYPDDLPRIQERYRVIVAEEDYSGPNDYRAVAKSGEICWMRLSSRPVVQDGRVIGVQGILTDITEQKLAEAGLRESEAKFRTLVDASPVATAIMQADRFLYVNPAWEEATGYQKSEALAMEPQMLFHPAMREEVFQRSVARLRGEAVPSRYEAQIITKDGRVRWFGFTATIITYEDIPAILTVSADITDRKQMQQQHLQLALEKERVRILSNFITQASHEFRTPLSIINTSAYLLKRQTNPDDQHPHIHKIEEQVAHIAQLISDLTMLADLDSIQHLEVMDIDVNEVVQTIANVLQPTLQEKGLRTVLELPDSPLLVPANVERLRQAIERILDNAIFHTAAGGTITVCCQPKAPNAVLEIADTGSGIQEDALPHIFERFYRADESGTTRGFGLGLPIAKAIIDLHHGHIEVESMEGKGSTFRILLPLA